MLKRIIIKAGSPFLIKGWLNARFVSVYM